MKRAAKSTKRKRDRNVSVWVDGDEAALLQRAADKADDKVSTWVRKTSLREARREVAS